MRLSNRHMQAIHLLIVGPKGPQGKSAIAERLGIRKETLALWRRDQDFQREYIRQLDIYRSNFEEIGLAERKARVQLLNDMAMQLTEADPVTMRTKMALIEQIRIEMGEGTPAEVNHLHRIVGVNLPPRASSYEEWVRQNVTMEKSRDEEEAEALQEPSMEQMALMGRNGNE